jgi:hypothetical protein
LSLPKSSFPKNSGITRADTLIAVNSDVANGNHFFKSVDGKVPPTVIDTATLKNTVTVNGVKYGMAENIGAAAGTRVYTKIYHTFQNGRWYEVQLNIWTSSDGSFELTSPDPVWEKLENVLEGMQYSK